MTIGFWDKRFGVIAVENGFITKDQLLEALKIQIEEELQEENHSLIGLILVELGYLTHDQVDEILLAMRQ